MTQMSHHINEMKRKHEHAVRVQEIQSQLEEYEGEDFTRLGELVLEVRHTLHKSDLIYLCLMILKIQRLTIGLYQPQCWTFLFIH